MGYNATALGNTNDGQTLTQQTMKKLNNITNSNLKNNLNNKNNNNFNTVKNIQKKNENSEKNYQLFNNEFHNLIQLYDASLISSPFNTKAWINNKDSDISVATQYAQKYCPIAEKNSDVKKMTTVPNNNNKTNKKSLTNKSVRPENIVKPADVYKLWSTWNYYSQNNYGNKKNTMKSIIKQQQQPKNNIAYQLSNIDDLEIKYNYRPETKKKPVANPVHLQQMIKKELEERRNARMRNSMKRVMLRRYSKKMETFIKGYKKELSTYEARIKFNLGLHSIKNSQASASISKSSNMKLDRWQKKQRLQQRIFMKQRRRFTNTKKYPCKWTVNYDIIFSKVPKFLNHIFKGFNYFEHQEYNGNLAWVKSNEIDNTGDRIISVASVLAEKYSPIPNGDPIKKPTKTTMSKTQDKEVNEKQQIQQSPSQQNSTKNAQSNKPLIIKMQTPQQLREQFSNKSNDSKKKTKKNAFNKINTINNKENGDNDSQNKKNKKKFNQIYRFNEPASPAIIIPQPAVWVKSEELPEKQAWGILQVASPSYSTAYYYPRKNNKKSKNNSMNKDETLKILFPQSNNRPIHSNNNKKNNNNNNNNNGKKNRNQAPKGFNISDKL